jgi:putative endonuclease
MNGAAAEELALRHLQGQGLKAVARNWRCRGGELDLVMRDGETLVIAEVRKRSSEAFGGAAASVDARKRGRIIQSAQRFLAEHPQFADAPVRFDVLALDHADNIQWLKAAFDGDG